jgi:N-acetylneuraminate synthase/N,N'-diacetyllegionaminate synthase
LILFGKDLEHEVAVVAEIGVNHEGDVEAARRLIDLAHAAGAHAIKLQTYTPDRYASASDPARLERVSRFSLDFDEHRKLAEHAKQHGMRLFSTALTEDVIPFLAQWCEVIKIASGDLVFEPAVRGAVASGKQVIISTGNGTLEEIERAVGWCIDELDERLVKERVALMHCVSAYPTPIDQANVLSVPFLKQRFGLATGYSNHVVEPEAVLAAVALGAQIVEVHVTDQKHGRDFRDHAMSMEPAELTALLQSIGRVKASLGAVGKVPQPCELGLRDAIRKGIVAARDLAEGVVLKDEDLMFARPATEIPAGEVGSVVGRRLTAPLHRGEQLLRRHLR